jgi:predicted DNA-binding transcriptional regulator YafY
MNLSKSAFRRYKVIDGLLRNTMKPYPSMQEIIEACLDKLDFEPSVETIQKDLANMRLPYPDGFDAPIRYVHAKKGYEYTDPNYSLTGIALKQEEIDTITEAVDLIRIIGGSRISNQFNHAVEKLLSATVESRQSQEQKRTVLQTMIPPVSRGFEYFDLFYEACKERIPISILHFSYGKRTFLHTILHPFLIKEFDNRWYVIGYSEKHDAVRTFGLDRINEPLKVKKKFQAANPSEVEAYLNDVYGVFPIPEAKKETIKIWANQLATHYYQAYPLHESQQIQKKGSGSSEITFELIPSIELARYFLSQGNQVRILSPKWFNQFAKDLKNEK